MEYSENNLQSWSNGDIERLISYTGSVGRHKLPQIAGSVCEIMDYPMGVDSESSLICDISRLGIHLIQQQNTQQQNYSINDVTALTAFLTKHSYHYCDIRVLLNNHTVNDVSPQTAEFYINTEELVKQHSHILRMVLQCLSSEDRLRLLHTKLDGFSNTLLHQIAVCDRTG